jgi:hypothetical protein
VSAPAPRASQTLAFGPVRALLVGLGAPSRPGSSVRWEGGREGGREERSMPFRRWVRARARAREERSARSFIGGSRIAACRLQSHTAPTRVPARRPAGRPAGRPAARQPLAATRPAPRRAKGSRQGAAAGARQQARHGAGDCRPAGGEVGGGARPRPRPLPPQPARPSAPPSPNYHTSLLHPLSAAWSYFQAQ